VTPVNVRTTLFRSLTAAGRFFTAPASPRPLAVFRIGLALVLLGQAYALAGSTLALFGSRGLVQWSITDGDVLLGVPRVRWVAELLAPLGASADDAVRLVFLVYAASLACLLIGWRTRLSAVLAWLTHLALNMSGNAIMYGVDQFAHIALFYCTWMPVGEALSADRRAGRTSGAASELARISLRVLQLHLCVVYFSSGIEKAMGEQWWNGEAIWRALMWPALGQFDFTWLASVPWLAMLACWGTLLVEIAYPLFIWHRRTRLPWALATIGLHLGIAVALGLVSFAGVMIVLNVAALLVPAEPQSEMAVGVVPEAAAA
jgi:HTTM domain